MARKDRANLIRPKNIVVHVTSLADNHKEIKNLFFDILADYVERFHVEITQEKVFVDICLVQMENEASSGVTIWAKPVEGEEESGPGHSINKILVQSHDPWIDGLECNQYTLHAHMGVLCHEMVHVCQKLTGRKGFKVSGAHWDKNNPREVYYNDPIEVEARCLSGLYTELYAEKIL